MKSNRRRRLKRSAAPNRDVIVPPTRQTAARLRPDVIGRLYAMDRIEDRHAFAAKQIRTVFEAVGRSQFPVLMPDSWTGEPPRRRPGRDFLDRMNNHERRLWQRFYLPWSHEMTVAAVTGLPGARWLRLVIGVVVENRTLRETEFIFGLARGRAFDFVVAGLEKYARHARLI